MSDTSALPYMTFSSPFLSGTWLAAVVWGCRVGWLGLREDVDSSMRGLIPRRFYKCLRITDHCRLYQHVGLCIACCILPTRIAPCFQVSICIQSCDALSRWTYARKIRVSVSIMNGISLVHQPYVHGPIAVIFIDDRIARPVEM